MIRTRMDFGAPHSPPRLQYLYRCTRDAFPRGPGHANRDPSAHGLVVADSLFKRIAAFVPIDGVAQSMRTARAGVDR